jgi:hypothetical protein
VASIEGETISSTEFTNKYGENINSVGPENVNLSVLSTVNPYSGLTDGGLKNYGFEVDPSVTGFSESAVSESLDAFVANVVLPGDFGIIYNGDCYGLSEETGGTPNIIIEPSELIDDTNDDTNDYSYSNIDTVNYSNKNGYTNTFDYTH